MRIALAAFTADDHVYLRGYNEDGYTLDDAASQTWKAIQKHDGLFMDADGNTLVNRQTTSGPIRLQWFNQPF